MCDGMGPLLIKPARQTKKPWLALEFLKAHQLNWRKKIKLMYQ
jgi:hypothetical protein